MNREELKNTPWKVEHVQDERAYNVYYRKDYLTHVVCENIQSEELAKAIAALPDTLAELELEKYHRRQDKKLAETLHADLKLSNQIHRKLEFELEKLKDENDQLKKRLSVAIDFIYSLAAGFPMSFWSRTHKAGEVLKEINP